MKKLALIPLLLVFAVTTAFIWFTKNSEAVSGQVNFINFNVPAGSNATQIGNELFNKGLIKNPLAFKVYVQFSGAAGSIQAGDYRLSPSFNLFQIVDQLGKSPLEVKVTIPEGLRREEVATRFAKNLDQGQPFIEQFLKDSKDLEGYLFPDTYLVSNIATPGAIITKMKVNFTNKVDSLAVQGSKLNEAQLITLASLIERETRTDEERPVVAGILLNRLNAGWPLQIDATVQYAVANINCKLKIVNCQWWEPLSSADLSINSAYNTYKNPGIPPGPIANPGLSSIKAAYNPQKSDYFFYLHDPTGTIHYAKTLDEQNANINKYLR